jgi:iron dependent repressor, metal binding and dimerisation domain protein
MVRLELINPDYSSSVQLTDKGKETAERLSENYRDVYAFFFDILKLDENQANDQSIQFLASFPEYTVEKMAAVTRNTIKKRKMAAEK